MTPDPSPRLTRRQVAWLATVGFGGLAAMKLGTRRLEQYPPAPRGLAVLADDTWAVLRAVGEVILPPTAGADARVLDEVVRRIDRVLQAAPTAVQRETRTLPVAIEAAPPLCGGRFARCTHLARPVRAGYLVGWAGRRLAVHRAGFAAVKRLIMLGYSTREAAWGAIGYAGPLV